MPTIRMCVVALVQMKAHHRPDIARDVVDVREYPVTAMAIGECCVDVDCTAQPAAAKPQVGQGWKCEQVLVK